MTQGLITGNGPDDQDRRDVWYLINKPYSVMVNGNWQSFVRYAEPVAFPLILITSMMERLLGLWKDKRVIMLGQPNSWLDEALGTVVDAGAAAAKALLNKTMLSSLRSLSEAATGEERSMWKVGLTGVVPSFSNWLARMTENRIMDPQSFLDYLRTRLPFGTRGDDPVYPKRDVFGDTIIRNKPLTEVGASKRALAEELNRLNVGIIRPSRVHHIELLDGTMQKYTMSESSFDEYQRQYGSLLFTA